MRDEQLDRMVDLLDGCGRALRWLLLAALWAALAFGLWAMACGRSDGAPVPFPRPTPTAEAWLTGTVDAMDWQGTSYRVRFEPSDADGFRHYRADCDGGAVAVWRGHWGVTGRTLLIAEWHVDRPGGVIRYGIDLDTGAVNGGYGSGFKAGLRPSWPGRR